MSLYDVVADYSWSYSIEKTSWPLKYFMRFCDRKMLTKLKTINIISLLKFTTYCIYKIF